MWCRWHVGGLQLCPMGEAHDWDSLLTNTLKGFQDVARFKSPEKCGAAKTLAWQASETLHQTKWWKEETTTNAAETLCKSCHYLAAPAWDGHTSVRDFFHVLARVFLLSSFLLQIDTSFLTFDLNRSDTDRWAAKLLSVRSWPTVNPNAARQLSCEALAMQVPRSTKKHLSSHWWCTSCQGAHDYHTQQRNSWAQITCCIQKTIQQKSPRSYIDLVKLLNLNEILRCFAGENTIFQRLSTSASPPSPAVSGASKLWTPQAEWQMICSQDVNGWKLIICDAALRLDHIYHLYIRMPLCHCKFPLSQKAVSVSWEQAWHQVQVR